MEIGAAFAEKSHSNPNGGRPRMFRRGRAPRSKPCSRVGLNRAKQPTMRRKRGTFTAFDGLFGTFGVHQGRTKCREEKSPNTPTSRNGKRSTSSKATKAAGFRKRKLSAAPGPRSTKTTVEESNRADRDGASRQVIPPRTRAEESAALRPLRDRQRVDRQPVKKRQSRASATQTEGRMAAVVDRDSGLPRTQTGFLAARAGSRPSSG
jgi:hypothetical protein